MTEEEKQEQQEIRVPVPGTPEVHTTVERSEQAIPHVVDHEHRLTTIERKQEEDIERLSGEITRTRDELYTALNTAKVEQAASLEAKLNELTATLQRVEQATTVEVPPDVAEDIEQAPTEAVEIVPEATPHLQEQRYKGVRERRQERHDKRKERT